MLRPLVTVILTLLVCIHVVSCRPNATRARRSFGESSESDPSEWVMNMGMSSVDSNDPSQWVMETSDSESTSSTDEYSFIGDMAFLKASPADGDIQNSMLTNVNRLWKNGLVPVKIQPAVRNRERKAILAAINAFHKETCINFVPYNSNEHDDYVNIKSNEPGCWSRIGRVGGGQDLNLQPGDHCGKAGTVIHEFMHALGIFHEQSRYDRDEYIEILWNNLQPGADMQFMKASKREASDYGVSYDYGSIMHYAVNQGSRRGLPAFKVLKDYDEASIGKGEYFSKSDIRRIKLLYRCNGSGPSPPRPNPPRPNPPRPNPPRPNPPRPNPPQPIHTGTHGPPCRCDCKYIGQDCKCDCNCDCSYQCTANHGYQWSCKWGSK